MSGPTITISFSAKRPGDKPFSSNDEFVMLKGVPIGATPELIAAMLDTANLAANMTHEHIMRRLGEAKLAEPNPWWQWEGFHIEARLMDGDSEVGTLKVIDFERIAINDVVFHVSTIESIAPFNLYEPTPEEVFADLQEVVNCGCEAIPEPVVEIPVGDSPPVPIPSAEDICLTSKAFGIEVSLPDALAWDMPITGPSEESAGQLATLCTLIGNFDLAGSRHDVAEILLTEMGYAAPERSFKALSKAQAHVLIDWLMAAATMPATEREVAALSQLREAVVAKSGQGVMF